MTMQARDIVIFQEQEYLLIGPDRLNDFVGEFGLDYIVTGTSGAGCDAQYAVHDGKLFLDRLSVCLGPFADYPPINGAMPMCGEESAEGQYENIGLLVPYTGIVEIGKDYDHNEDMCMGPFECNYRTRLLLKFENGILESSQDISSQRGEKVLVRPFPQEKAAPKKEPVAVIPDGIPKKNIYTIHGEHYTFLCFLGFLDQGFTPWFNDSGLFRAHLQVPYGIGGFVEDAFYPVFNYKMDADSEVQLQGLWFPLHRNDNVNKVKIFGQKPDNIIGESPRFACFAFAPRRAVNHHPTGLLLLGADGEGRFPWNYGKVVIARLYNGKLLDTQDVSNELDEVRQWVKEHPDVNNASPCTGATDEYAPFIAAFPELYKRRPWWFLDFSERDYTDSDIIGTDEFAELLLKEKEKQDAILMELEKESKEAEAIIEELRRSSIHRDA